MMRIRSQRGFSLMEMLASLAILSLVLGVVMEGVVTMHARNDVETNKVDLTQESREFMDQIVNDLRQSGFPRGPMFDPATLNPVVDGTHPFNCTNYPAIACGLMYVSPTSIQFEGDVDGSGVSDEWIQLVQTNGSSAACGTPPCVLQRGTLPKTCILTPATCTQPLTVVGGVVQPVYYTEVNGVMNTTVFSVYDNTGTDLSASLPISNAYIDGYNNYLNIRSIGITLYLRALQTDMTTHQYPTVTMVSTARVND